MPKVRTAARRAYERQWREENKAWLREMRLAWEAKNKEELLAKKRAYYAANAAVIKVRVKANRKPLSLEAQKRREDARLLRATGFTAENLELMLQAQKYKCGICKTDLSVLRRRDWHADHCHETNTARGILCSQCNMALGLFKDDIERLQSAISYLTNPPGEFL